MKLYLAPGGRSLAVHVLLRELELDFDVEEIPMAEGRSDHPELKERTGLGQAPSLLLPNGEVLTETIAILVHLAERYPDRAFMPTDPVKRARCFEWMSFLQTEVAPTLGAVIHPERYVQSKGAAREVEATVRPRIDVLFGEIDRRLSGRTSVLDAYGVCDTLLIVCYLWGRHVGLPMSEWPNLKSWARATFARPAVRGTLEAEGLSS